MNAQEKLQLLTGALAAEVDRKTHRFWGFRTITEELAYRLLTNNGVSQIVIYTGELCFIDGELVYHLADKSLAVIAED